jgi:hypothetical protein
LVAWRWAVVEVGGNRDDGLADLLAEVSLGIGLQLAEDERRNLLRGELLGLVADLHLDVGVAVLAGGHLVGEVLGLFADLGEFAADEALGGENGVLGVGHGLALGGLADDTLAGLGERHDGRRRARALGVRNDDRFPALHDCHAGIGRA